MRVWDGVTDPVIGFVVDKTNGRFGKNRPFIVIGNVIMIITTYILYHFGHGRRTLRIEAPVSLC